MADYEYFPFLWISFDFFDNVAIYILEYGNIKNIFYINQIVSWKIYLTIDPKDLSFWFSTKKEWIKEVHILKKLERNLLC